MNRAIYHFCLNYALSFLGGCFVQSIYYSCPINMFLKSAFKISRIVKNVKECQGLPQVKRTAICWSAGL